MKISIIFFSMMSLEDCFKKTSLSLDMPSKLWATSWVQMAVAKVPESEYSLNEEYLQAPSERHKPALNGFWCM
jgi:hypothetical protein